VPLCPECRAGRVELDAPDCPSCGWGGDVLEGGVVDMLARRDGESALFRAYLDLYDRIAADDLGSPIQGDELLELEAQRLFDTLGEVTGEAVCDVGVGRGLLFERLLAGRPRLLVGVDLAVGYLQRLATGRPDVRLVRANAESLPFRGELDAIVASDVLEHVLNPADFLESAVDALVPGGRLLVKVPYRENISQYKRSAGCPYEMVHLRTFDRPLLRKALVDSGLRPERITYSGFYHDRWRPFMRRFPRMRDWANTLIERRYGPDPGPNRMDPRLGRLLMEPVVITVLARKLRDD
jgi:SAM-dependent methyltransferase